MKRSSLGARAALSSRNYRKTTATRISPLHRTCTKLAQFLRSVQCFSNLGVRPTDAESDCFPYCGLKFNPGRYLTWVLPKLAAAMTKITTGLLPHDYADLALH